MSWAYELRKVFTFTFDSGYFIGTTKLICMDLWSNYLNNANDYLYKIDFWNRHKKNVPPGKAFLNYGEGFFLLYKTHSNKKQRSTSKNQY